MLNFKNNSIKIILYNKRLIPDKYEASHENHDIHKIK